MVHADCGCRVGPDTGEMRRILWLLSLGSWIPEAFAIGSSIFTMFRQTSGLGGIPVGSSMNWCGPCEIRRERRGAGGWGASKIKK